MSSSGHEVTYIALMAIFVTLGCLGVWLRERRSSSAGDTVSQFRRGLDALAPRGSRADEGG